MELDQESDEESVRLYEDGHWQWDNTTNTLQFVSEICSHQEDKYEFVKDIFKNLTSAEFTEDIDLFEQQRFRKFQRKYEDQDVVTLQDIKDVVLFTAPHKILTPKLINLLHLWSMDRLLRALILYCQYYLQVSESMETRILESKIRTPNSELTEATYQKNLQDLRVLVAKEYSLFITGSGEYAKYHHMGIRKIQSSSLKESLVFEALARIFIQIVWVALGRKSFTDIETEVHRLLKSQFFNIAQHKIDKGLDKGDNVMSYKRNDKILLENSSAELLLGQCAQKRRKVNTLSPLMKQIHCTKRLDYRLLELGIIKYSRLNERLQYLEKCLILPEMEFLNNGISIGIVGLNRNKFDILLKPILKQPRDSRGGSRSAISFMTEKLSNKNDPARYDDIELPRNKVKENQSVDEFPLDKIRYRSNDSQRLKWLKHVKRRRRSRTVTVGT